ncbi:AraC family transcriptional regulator [Streptococcus cuniculi]|uniref:AraC family transcriptional regulator n=1 Tax=Streptococcus cuniculi TaxID=1432788 RepID=A0A1Q8E802_9STRE|nr:AraC family transcriptional regulator [Streptococcus cuniculi]OLF47906.1 AraC family transcriptional regulator [Streptococcus cuniculi]
MPDNTLLPCYFQEIQVINQRPDILFHWHQEMEIHYIHRGSGRFHIDSDFFNSQAGDIILIRPNGMHSIHPLEKVDEPHRFDVFRFHLDFLGQSMVDQASLHYLQPLQNGQFKFVPCIKPSMPGYSEIKACFFAIIELIKQEDSYFELMLKAKLNELVYLLFCHQYVVKKNTNDMYRKNETLRFLIDFINQHYVEPLSIAQLAELSGYSKPHFMAMFKQYTGSSCTDFIIQVRLSKACDLLTNTTKSILEIATEVGFHNLSNFNRQFKKLYHLTPKAYRSLEKKPNYVGPYPNAPRL